MAERIQVYQKVKGSLMENEDWWYLVVDDNGNRHVEHEWSHVDPYGKREPNSGKIKISIDDFLRGDHEAAAKEALKAELAKG